MTLLEVAEKWNALTPDERRKRRQACMDRGTHVFIDIPVGWGCKVRYCKDCLVVLINEHPLNSIL